MEDTEEPSAIGDYLASHEGPFFRLQRRLGMLREDALLAPRRAVIFVALAWGVPFLLSLAGGRAFSPVDENPYLLDFGAWARFFIAVGLMILAEQQVEDGLRGKIRQFVRAPLLAPTSFAAAADAVATALKRRNSGIAELVCLVIAFIGCFAWFEHLEGVTLSDWATEVDSSGPHVTLAGWWSVFISSTIFNFLLLRGLWRYILWAMLVWRISTLELRLVAAHPDGKAGLGFVADYPNAYATFVFGLSSAVAIVVVRHVSEGGMTQVTFGYIIGAWLAIVLAFFGFPLLAFARPLTELKTESLRFWAPKRRAFIDRLSARCWGATPSPTIPRKRRSSRRLSIRPRNTRSPTSSPFSC